MRFVLDCSMTMSWCFEDEADAAADAVLDCLIGSEARVPSIWPLEVATVLPVAERRGRLRPDGPALALPRMAARHPRVLRENLAAAA